MSVDPTFYPIYLFFTKNGPELGYYTSTIVPSVAPPHTARGRNTQGLPCGARSVALNNSHLLLENQSVVGMTKEKVIQQKNGSLKLKRSLVSGSAWNPI